jgi:hypothetical protein
MDPTRDIVKEEPTGDEAINGLIPTMVREAPGEVENSNAAPEGEGTTETPEDNESTSEEMMEEADVNDSDVNDGDGGRYLDDDEAASESGTTRRLSLALEDEDGDEEMVS